MMRKILTAISTVFAAVACAVGLSACVNPSLNHEHKFENYIYNNDATCIANGTETGTCSYKNCDATDTRMLAGSSTGNEHRYNNGYCELCHNYDPDYKITEGLDYDEVKEDGEVVSYAVIGLGSATSKYIVIPHYYRGKPVTEIYDAAFKGEDKLRSVTIPDSVKSIGSEAFKDCTDLITVEMSSKLTSIGESAFRGCKSLTDIEIPKGVTAIENSVFYECEKLKSVSISGKNVTSIGDYAFYCCYKLKSANIPNTVENIGNYAFSDCFLLENITIPKKAKTIGRHAFESCWQLKSAEIPSTVTEIADSVFYGCYALESVTIPSSVQSIGANAFELCKELKKVTIPGSVTAIDSGAFYCSGLTDINIPKSVEYIGTFAFGLCNDLSTARFENPNGWYYLERASSPGKSISDFELSGYSSAADLLTSTYKQYIWRRLG